MIISQDIEQARAKITHWRSLDKRVALVLTMGNLHQGHLALIRQAQTQADYVVVSIFINPLQFGASEDLAAYPRTLAQDMEKLIQLGVNLLFQPTESLMYPKGKHATTLVTVPGGWSDVLCGAVRPGHFTGVTTIVCKLFHILPVHVAVFGEKDFQQWLIIKKMAKDLNLPIDIVSHATVRELDGLAMSSRNQYLSETQRHIAPLLYQSLLSMANYLQSNGVAYQEKIAQQTQHLTQQGFDVEYFSVRSTATLAEWDGIRDEAIRIFIAARLGDTRLIDNVAV